jgi:hypothetical protein
MRSFTLFLLLIAVLLGVTSIAIQLKTLKNKILGIATRNISLGTNIYGATSYNDQASSEPVTVYGAFSATNVEFHEKLTVYGATNLSKSLVRKRALVHGALNASHVTFLDAIEMYGAFKAEHSFFKKTITVSGVLTLYTSEAQDIVVKTERKDNPTVTLYGSTKVHGSITFEHDGGTVYLHDTATVGTVLGGKIIKK